MVFSCSLCRNCVISTTSDAITFIMPCTSSFPATCNRPQTIRYGRAQKNSPSVAVLKSDILTQMKVDLLIRSANGLANTSYRSFSSSRSLAPSSSRRAWYLHPLGAWHLHWCVPGSSTEWIIQMMLWSPSSGKKKVITASLKRCIKRFWTILSSARPNIELVTYKVQKLDAS